VVAYFFNFFQQFQKKTYKGFYCNFSLRLLKCFKFVFALKKLKKPPSKVAQNNSNPLFFLTAWAAQTTQTEEFMLQNVAYRTTVYRTGVRTFHCLNKLFYLVISKILKIVGLQPRISKVFSITRTIFSHSRPEQFFEQFLLTEYFFNLFLDVSQI
jgi:hypothetical protein